MPEVDRLPDTIRKEPKGPRMTKWDIERSVTHNGAGYFEKTLITENGFREYDFRWQIGDEINANGFYVLGKAYGTYARQVLGEDKVVVGHDFRSYSQELSRSFALGVVSSGVDVVDIGLAMTPIVYFAQYHLSATAAAMVTASHNENGWTGLKLANGYSSTMGPAEVEDFKKLVYSQNYLDGAGTYLTEEGVFDAYLADLTQRGTVIKGLKVVVGAGNGTAGHFGPPILKALGCEVFETHCALDWNFPNYNPNPENVAFLQSLSEEVKRRGADLGVGFDGDGDRIGVVDNEGEIVFSDKLGLLLARHLSAKVADASFVIDVKSTGLFLEDEILRNNGASVVLWKTGHSYIKKKVAETGAVAGFEKSGHWFFSKPFGKGYDDAMMSSVQLMKFLDESGRPLSELVASLPATWLSPTVGAHCADGEKYDVVDQAIAAFTREKETGGEVAGRQIKEINTINGIRFTLEDGSFGLIRASSNKPSLVLVAESRQSHEDMTAILARLKACVEATGKTGEYDQ